MSAATIVTNLTPHWVNIVDPADKTTVIRSFEPASVPARCVEKRTDEGVVSDNIPVSAVSYGEVTGLPPRQQGTIYIVSMLVAQTHPHRKDLMFPGEIVRDERGVIIGTTGLSYFSVNF